MSATERHPLPQRLGGSTGRARASTRATTRPAPGLVMVAGGVLASLVWWAWPEALPPPAASAAAQTFPWDKVPLQVAAEQAATTADAALVDTPDSAPAANCGSQALRLRLGSAEAVNACVSRTQVHQNGSVRSFEVQAEDQLGWSLKVAFAGKRVMSVHAHNSAGDSFHCGGGDADKACAAVSLGRADRRGERQLQLSDQLLAGKLANAEPLRVSARLVVPADDQVAGLACDGPSVFLGGADGARQKFCAHGGAGIEFTDDGKLRVQFHNHEGEALSIALGVEGSLERVEFGPYACAGQACNGASASVAVADDPLAERQFFFGHTVLTRTGGERDRPDTLTVDGNLVLAAQQ
ncbi:MAG: hypothetical protein RL375_1471 [Pseudomonadota bacterium]|jgi:hypothetical protein